MKWFLFMVVAAAVVAWIVGMALLKVMLAIGVSSEIAIHVATKVFLVGAFGLLVYGALWTLRQMNEAPFGIDVTHGSARFMNDIGTAKLAKSDGLIVGRDFATRKLLRFDGEGHLMTLAPTRSGKGVGTIIPNLLTYAGPVVCIDPKGENTQVAATRRCTFGAVHVLDPFGVSGAISDAYNPLDAIDPASADGPEDAAALADALVADPPGQVHEAHWNEEAKALIAGILLHIADDPRPERRTLARLRELLTLPPAFFAALLDDMAASDAARGLVARAANRQRGKSDREATGVLSSAQRHTHFLDSERIDSVTYPRRSTSMRCAMATHRCSSCCRPTGWRITAAGCG